MEWVNLTNQFSHKDEEQFGFHAESKAFNILTIKISRTESYLVQYNGTTFEKKDLHTEEEYVKWIEELQPSLSGTHCPTLVLVIHQRLDDHEATSTGLPYTKATFRKACGKLFQHRTITNTLKRASATVFNSRPIYWGNNTPGKSIVYNCVSNTEALPGEGDMVLSTTYFTESSLTYGVLYGCASDGVLNLIASWLESFQESFFHPLMLPMVFMELERKRLLDAAAAKGTILNQRVLEMEAKAKKEGTRAHQKERSFSAATTGDSETIKMLLSMNGLKNGLDGLREQLSSMRIHLGKPSELALSKYEDERSIKDHCGFKIDLRLREMIAELQSRSRYYTGLLETMTLATQMEATDFTRTDSWVNFTIAKASKRDSTQMRLISFMGMVFLPGTFLATLFSMTFFNWLPSGSDQVLSPWVALYFGLTIVLTAFTIWFWNRRNNRGDWDEEAQFMRDLHNAKSLMDLASTIKRTTSTTQSAGDDESQVEPKPPIASQF